MKGNHATPSRKREGKNKTPARRRKGGKKALLLAGWGFLGLMVVLAVVVLIRLLPDRETTDPALAIEIVDAWLDTEFEGGRHQRRVDMLDEM